MAPGVGAAAAATLFFFLRDLNLLFLLADEEQVEDAMELVDAIVSDSFSLAPRDPAVLGGHFGATHSGGTPPAELAEEAVRPLAGGAPVGAESPAATVAQVQVPEPLGAAAPPPTVSAGLGAGWAGAVLAPVFFFFFLLPVDAEPEEDATEVVDVNV